MRVVTILTLITSLCTCASAQVVIGEPLKFEASSIAFIKQANSRLIDSIAISTSTDEKSYGFAFPDDTLLMDVEVLLPVDELTIETFAGGHSFGVQRCWVDPPSADIYLSIVAGKGVVDSVGLSEVDRWYRAKVESLMVIKKLPGRKYVLGRSIYDLNEDLVVTRFIEAYLLLPNLTKTDVFLLWQVMNARFEPIREHPDFQRLLEHANLLANHKPAWFKKMAFRDAKGRLRQLPKPSTEFFLLELYDKDDPVCQENHRFMKTSPVIDSLLQKVPMISLTKEDSPALWRLYVKDNDFKWLHGLEEPIPRIPALEEWAISPHSTYLLVDKKFKLLGAYPDLQRMASGVWWHSRN